MVVKVSNPRVWVGFEVRPDSNVRRRDGQERRPCNVVLLMSEEGRCCEATMSQAESFESALQPLSISIEPRLF